MARERPRVESALCTLDDACEYLCMSKTSFYRGPRKVLPVVNITPGRVLYRKADLDAFISENTHHAA